MRSKLHVLKNDRGEASYIGSVVFILVGALFLSLIISVFNVLSVKIKLDQSADQLVKQIQLQGGVNSETINQFEVLKSSLSVDDVTFHYDAQWLSKPTPMYDAVQLGTPFTVTLKAKVQLGGFWRVLPVNFYVQSKAAGVGEYFWK